MNHRPSPGKTARDLYNGIRLPAVWPPRVAALPEVPSTPYYLHNPPPVIPIDVGRQLFVDDFLIAETTLTRTFYRAVYHPANPVVRPDRPWEQEGDGGNAPSAMTFPGGVWYDPRDACFKMFYEVLFTATCLATSTDGVQWEKPHLDVCPGTNMVHRRPRDMVTVWLDQEEPDPTRRFKMLVNDVDWSLPGTLLGPKLGLAAYYSADGIHWSDEVCRVPYYGDGCSIFRNPFRQVWCASLRASHYYWDQTKPLDRIRRYHEARDFADAIRWGTAPADAAGGQLLPAGVDHSVLWTRADNLDAGMAGARDEENSRPELYSLQAVAYESILLGGFSLLPGVRQGTKLNYGVLGFSRDGFTWDRPHRAPFLARGTFGAWNSGYLHFASGLCAVMGDTLYFYCTARQPVTGGTTIDGKRSFATGLATLRRDGFASMDAVDGAGTLTTRPVTFHGCHLFVNVDTAHGALRVEVLDESGTPIAPFTAANCVPVTVDATCQAVHWRGAEQLSALAGQPVRFKFSLTHGKLYAFWVSPSATGASNGYVAAGGPGFAGPRDV